MSSARALITPATSPRPNAVYIPLTISVFVMLLTSFQDILREFAAIGFLFLGSARRYAADTSQVQPKHTPLTLTLFSQTAGDVELIRFRTPECHTARREQPGRVLPYPAPFSADHLHDPHSVMSDVEIAALIEAKAVGLIIDLPALFDRQSRQHFHWPQSAGRHDIIS